MNNELNKDEPVDSVADKILEFVEELVEVDKGTLRLHMRILRHVPPSSGFLRPIRLRCNKK